MKFPGRRSPSIVDDCSGTRIQENTSGLSSPWTVQKYSTGDCCSPSHTCKPSVQLLNMSKVLLCRLDALCRHAHSVHTVTQCSCHPTACCEGSTGKRSCKHSEMCFCWKTCSTNTGIVTWAMTVSTCNFSHTYMPPC